MQLDIQEVQIFGRQLGDSGSLYIHIRDSELRDGVVFRDEWGDNGDGEWGGAGPLQLLQPDGGGYARNIVKMI